MIIKKLLDKTRAKKSATTFTLAYRFRTVGHTYMDMV